MLGNESCRILTSRARSEKENRDLLQQRAVFGLFFGVLGGITTAAATLSSVSRVRSLTRDGVRPAERMVILSIRMMLPNWLISIISVVSATSLMAETLSISGMVFMEMAPLPPLGWTTVDVESVLSEAILADSEDKAEGEPELLAGGVM